MAEVESSALLGEPQAGGVPPTFPRTCPHLHPWQLAGLKAILQRDRRVAVVVSILIALLILAWGAAGLLVALNPGSPVLPLCVLAFLYGLRHAVDADHIAAIDNVTRKLLQDGRRSYLVGMWFSLGHSTVIWIVCLVLVFVSADVISKSCQASTMFGLVGTIVSASFLCFIGLVNLAIMMRLVRAYRRGVSPKDPAKVAGRGSVTGEAEEDEEDDKRCCAWWRNRKKRKAKAMQGDPGVGGPCSSLLGCLFRWVDREYKIYFIGFLFGLGFDTSTETGLFMITALNPGAIPEHCGSASMKHSPTPTPSPHPTVRPIPGVPGLGALALPLLFTVSMCLLDTLDGVLMGYAYGWAAAQPRKRLMFNITVTGLSTVVALLVGGFETLALISQLKGWNSPFWMFIQQKGMTVAGYAVVGIFALVLLFILGINLLGKLRKRKGPCGGRAEQLQVTGPTDPPPCVA